MGGKRQKEKCLVFEKNCKILQQKGVSDKTATYSMSIPSHPIWEKEVPRATDSELNQHVDIIHSLASVSPSTLRTGKSLCYNLEVMPFCQEPYPKHGIKYSSRSLAEQHFVALCSEDCQTPALAQGQGKVIDGCEQSFTIPRKLPRHSRAPVDLSFPFCLSHSRGKPQPAESHSTLKHHKF